MKLVNNGIFLWVLVWVTFIYAQDINEYKIIPADGADEDLFGNSVSISGDYAIIGAVWDDDLTENSGSAYIFKREGTTWVEQVKLAASDGAEEDRFGISVCIEGDYAVVGAFWDDDRGINSGSAYIFKRNDSTWTEHQKLTASDGTIGDNFGSSVHLTVDYIIIGAIGDSVYGWESGSAYIFMRNGSTWTEQVKLIPDAGSEYFGFGSSVSIAGDYTFVGMPGDSINGFLSGSVYIFKLVDDTTWILQDKLIEEKGAENHLFGYSISMNEDYAVIGAPGGPWSTIFEGAAYIYKRDSSNWILDKMLIANDRFALDFFGQSVSISGDYVIVGAPKDDDLGSYSGSAYIFKRDGPAWSQYKKLTAGDGADRDYFGTSVCLNETYAVVGAPDDDDNGFNSGSAYVYSDFVTGINENILNIPTKFRLEQNYPNPFNPVTTIEYSIAKTAKVEIIVFDILGREVAKLVNETKKAGNHEVNFDASKYSSGLYFYKINAGEYSHVKRMLLLK